MSQALLRQATLCILTRGDPPQQVLLGYKKAGFGQGKYTGFGGKVKEGETLAQAASREMLEESSVLVPLSALRHVAQLDFIFPHRPDWSQAVHVFLASTWQGQPQESAEMVPRWFHVDALPYAKMWVDATHWLPPILEGKLIQARFVFAKSDQALQEIILLDLGEHGDSSPHPLYTRQEKQ